MAEDVIVNLEAIKKDTDFIIKLLSKIHAPFYYKKWMFKPIEVLIKIFLKYKSRKCLKM